MGYWSVSPIDGEAPRFVKLKSLTCILSALHVINMLMQSVFAICGLMNPFFLQSSSLAFEASFRVLEVLKLSIVCEMGHACSHDPWNPQPYDDALTYSQEPLLHY